MIRSVFSALVLSMALVLSVPAHANSGELLNFIGLGNLQPVGDFYDGGGLSVTPNYGVSFSSNFFGLRSIDNGGAGNFSSTPISTPAIFINGTTGAMATGTMNVWSGFSGGINFFYSAGFTAGQTETVTLWSGVNGTGTVLGTIVLGNNSGGCTFPAYCNWTNVGVTLGTGITAKSVTFTGPANQLGLTDITLNNNATAIPEPSSIYLLGTGMGLLSLGSLRRFFVNTRQ
jgi:hypothetical protein